MNETDRNNRSDQKGGCTAISRTGRERENEEVARKERIKKVEYNKWNSN